MYQKYITISFLGLFLSFNSFSQNLSSKEAPKNHIPPVKFLEDTESSIQIDSLIDKKQTIPFDETITNQYAKGCNLLIEKTLISIKSIDNVKLSQNKLGFGLFNSKSYLFHIPTEHIPSIIHYISQNRYNCSRPLRHRTNLYPSRIH